MVTRNAVVSCEDSGLYQCTADNRMGPAESTAYRQLTVSCTFNLQHPKHTEGPKREPISKNNPMFLLALSALVYEDLHYFQIPFVRVVFLSDVLSVLQAYQNHKLPNLANTLQQVAATVGRGEGGTGGGRGELLGDCSTVDSSPLWNMRR